MDGGYSWQQQGTRNRPNMGNEHTKPVDKLKFIDREVNSLRSSIRSTRRNISSQTKEEYITLLARFSSEAGGLKGKVKNKYLEETQKNISNVMNEILTRVPSENDLDMGAIETSSFIEVPLNKRQASNKATSERPSKKQKSSQVDAVKRNTTLIDIEEKLKTLKPQINVAIENKDTTMLRLHQETIKVLATDLEMIVLTEDTPIAEKKKKLESSITSQFQKITKAMKEIKRNKDINYLVKQTKKERSLKELEEIKRNLGETDVMLKASLKNSDSSSMKGIQEKLIEINQRLSSVDVPDETTRKMKMELMDHFKGIYKYINDTSKHSSQSDLSKAQSNYEDIVKTIASGQNKDKGDIKVKLQSLQSFINNIKEDDENSLRRKEQLLNNVRQSFSFILDEKKPETSTGTIPKKTNTSYKELDNFYNNWKSVQKAIKSTTHSTDEVAKIDKILRDIQNSIGHTRQQITGIASEQSNINTKLNYSTPNLSSAKTRPNYEPSLSLDHSGQLIKTRAKVYNLSTPEIRNIGDQPVVLRNKNYYKNNEFEDGYRFSKIEEIKTQVNYIKEKFSESQQKQHLKNKLESYVEILDEYVHHKNQTTANNARIVLSDIQEMLKNMSHIQEAMNTAQRRMSVEDSLENISGVQAAVDQIQKDIDNFSGRRDDEEYTKMKNGLLVCRQCLDDTNVPPKYDMIQQQKEQILEKITNLLKTLENDYYEDSHVTGIEEAVNKLQNAIVMFSGKKGDNEYTKIRDSLVECRNRLEDTIIPEKYEMLQRKKEEILKKIPHLFATLEIKSSNHQEDPVLIITRRNLNQLKDAVRRFSGAYRGVLYNKLEKDLNKLLLDVGVTIADKTAIDEIVKDVEKHLRILEQRSTKDQSFRRTFTNANSKNEGEDPLVRLKSDMMSIKAAIDTTPTNGVNLFVGLKSRLDLIKLGLDQLKFMSEEDEKQREVLYNEVESYKNIVEAKISLAKQAIRQWPFEHDKNRRYEEEMTKIEEKFRSIKPEIENFIGTTSDNKFYELDESSIRLVLRMDKLQFTKGTEIYNKKINLLKEIYSYGDLLDQRAKETEDIIEIETEIYDLEKNFERSLRLSDLQSLQDKVDKLQTKINDTETNRNLLDRKQRCVTKIKSLADRLREIKENSDKEVAVIERDSRRISKDPANEISEIERRLVYFKNEIEQFGGKHNEQKYYELHRNISILFAKLDKLQLPEQSELHSMKLKLLKEMQKYFNILDKKATDNEIVAEIAKQLIGINTKVDNYRGANEELKVMESELKSVQSKLNKFKTSDVRKITLEQKYDILLEEFNRLMKAKKLPKDNYIGSTSFLADVQNLNKTKTSLDKEEDPLNAQIAEIQRGIDEIRGQVEVFTNSDTSEEYKKIEENSLRLQLRVNKLNIAKDNQLYQRKLELEKNIKKCLMILDERAQEADSLITIEKEIEDLSKKFDGIMSESEKDSIDEKLISLQVKLGKLHVSDELNQRKDKCTNKIITYSKQMNDKPPSHPNSNPEEEPRESLYHTSTG